MDDIAIGRVVRALRHRLGLRQSDVGERAAMSQGAVSLVERGKLDRLPLRRLRRLLAVFDAELVLVVRWRGGDLDRLLDAGHARLAEAMTLRLTAAGWQVQPEVSFSEYGERGSIDLLAWHPSTRILLVIELKTEITSVEETLRVHDVKCRLAPRIALHRFGWDVALVGRLLVLPDERTPRDQVGRHQSVFTRACAERTVAVRRWISEPSGAMSGIMFLRSTVNGRARRRSTGRKRVRPNPLDPQRANGGN